MEETLHQTRHIIVTTFQGPMIYPPPARDIGEFE